MMSGMKPKANTGGEPGGTAAETQPAASGRLPALDVLRGIAIAWVIGFHLSVNVGGLDPIDDKYTAVTDAARDSDPGGIAVALWHLVLGLGYQGVPLFMMLSGFTLTYSIIRSGGRISLAAFYRRRLPALLIPYWLAFALTMTAIVLLAALRSALQDPGFATQLGELTRSGKASYPLDWSLVLAGAAFVPRGFREPWIFAPSPSLWFVFLLVQFYAVFPLLFRALERLGAWPFLALALVLTALSKIPIVVGDHGYGLLFNWWIDNQFLPFNLFTFALGMSAAWLFVHDRDALRRYTSGRSDSLLLIYGGLLLHTAGSLAQGRAGIIGLISGPMVVLGLTLIVMPWIANASETRPVSRPVILLVAAGAISYSLLIASDPLQYAVGTMYSLDAPTWVWVVYWLLYLPALLGLAWCVERASRLLVSAIAPKERRTEGEAAPVAVRAG